jgi:hypothetical protein
MWTESADQGGSMISATRIGILYMALCEGARQQ